jgi:23S rRNA pseudouridine2605 synthase
MGCLPFPKSRSTGAHVPQRRSRPSQPQEAAATPASGGERLQKVLAAAGIASRRECEELMLQGRVEVDGHCVTELGTRVNPFQQRIRVDGVALPRPRRAYYMLNKPTGVVCTNRDPSGRPRAVDLIGTDEHLFTVGRLDRSSEGLILVTNDGELSNRLTHPRYGVQKLYRVRVAGHPPVEILQQLRKGVHFAEGFARVAGIRIRRRYRDSTELEITLAEGRNREIRRLLARVGHKVMRLQRIAFGPLRLGDLPVGAHRRLTPQEIRQLERESDPNAAAQRGSGSHRGRRPTTKRPVRKKKHAAPGKRSGRSASRDESKRATRKKGPGRGHRKTSKKRRS